MRFAGWICIFKNYRLTFHAACGIVSKCVKAHNSKAEVFTLTLRRMGWQAFIGQTEVSSFAWNFVMYDMVDSLLSAFFVPEML